MKLIYFLLILLIIISGCVDRQSYINIPDNKQSPNHIVSDYNNYQYEIKVVDDSGRIQYNRYAPASCYINIPQSKLVEKVGDCDKTDINILREYGIIIK